MKQMVASIIASSQWDSKFKENARAVTTCVIHRHALSHHQVLHLPSQPLPRHKHAADVREDAEVDRTVASAGQR